MKNQETPFTETNFFGKSAWRVQGGSRVDSDMLEILGNWNLLTIGVLAETPGIVMSPDNVSARIGISSEEAKSGIDALTQIGALEETGERDKYRAVPLFLDDAHVPAADLLNIFSRLSQFSKTKITSKDFFGHKFESMNRKIILKYLPEIYSLIQKIQEESQGLADNEVYSFEYCFAKATQSQVEKKP